MPPHVIQKKQGGQWLPEQPHDFLHALGFWRTPPTASGVRKLLSRIDVAALVKNKLLEVGCTISDLISMCIIASSNKGQFLICVRQLTKQLKEDKILTKRDAAKINSTAAKAKISFNKSVQNYQIRMIVADAAITEGGCFLKRGGGGGGAPVLR